jgi:phosphotransferase system  glucose/maltose/N-acetylglucosamine-specific IIC component
LLQLASCTIHYLEADGPSFKMRLQINGQTQFVILPIYLNPYSMFFFFFFLKFFLKKKKKKKKKKKEEEEEEEEEEEKLELAVCPLKLKPM